MVLQLFFNLRIVAAVVRFIVHVIKLSKHSEIFTTITSNPCHSFQRVFHCWTQCDLNKQTLPADVDYFGRRHYLYEQKIARMTWKIDSKNLLMAGPADISASDKTVSCIHFTVSFVYSHAAFQSLVMGTSSCWCYFLSCSFIFYFVASLGVWDRRLMTRPVSDRPRSWSWSCSFGLRLGLGLILLVLFPTLFCTTRRCVTW